MKHARIVEEDYDAFKRALTACRKAGSAIEPGDEARWRDVIAAEKLNAKAFATLTIERHGAEGLVFLSGGDLPGLFAFNDTSARCWRYAVVD